MPRGASEQVYTAVHVRVRGHVRRALVLHQSNEHAGWSQGSDVVLCADYRGIRKAPRPPRRYFAIFPSSQRKWTARALRVQALDELVAEESARIVVKLRQENASVAARKNATMSMPLFRGRKRVDRREHQPCRWCKISRNLTPSRRRAEAYEPANAAHVTCVLSTSAITSEDAYPLPCGRAPNCALDLDP
ncbi:uncharacterized protein SCHCODRAFT_02283371 [Schizophyllum commune H4-8]|uniref:uncharacterized protein n=1 Tax=Schizophyllum commune (strain H4-8 / FGSC 9210) TaxID=578458 RepID=UPI00215F3461|nr:uncharacterized protein SCHCODRAFT_02283371 [Schizophyllum commune H4-8]KAI5892100.1 hypothetical protein SCHCODRAFT_02283371 [Schizophyllum commune H4-8]